MAQKYQELSDKIVGLVGGKANVQFFTHCVTRLRFNVKDESAVKKDEIEKLPGVLGSQWQNGQYQIIIGQAVNDAYRLICEKNGFAVEKSVDEKLDDEKPAQKKGVKAVIDKIFDGISGSLTPLIPALIGCGMIKVILILMDMAGVPADSGTYQLLTFAGDAGFYFLPIMIGAFAAKKFGANPALGMVIGGLLIYPSFASGVSDGTAFNFLGLLRPRPHRFFPGHLPEHLRPVAVQHPGLHRCGRLCRCDAVRYHDRYARCLCSLPDADADR